MSSQSHLLERYRLFRTSEVDEARVRTAKVFCDHRLKPVHRVRNFDARHNAVRWRSTSLHYVTYSEDVKVDPGALGNFFVTLVPISGSCDIRLGSAHFTTAAGSAAVVSPTEPLEMSWSADCATLIYKYDAHSLTDHVEKLLHDQVNKPLRFDPSADLTTGRQANWWKLHRGLADRLEAGDPVLTDPLMTAPLEQSLMTMLLVSHSHNYSARLRAGSAPAPARRDIRAVVDWVESDPGRPMTVGDLAAVAGTSVRTLQYGFDRHVGTSPMTFVRDVRLRRAYEELCSADPSEPGVIAKTARRYGFTHLGRFAVDFRRRFGASPKDIVHRTKSERLDRSHGRTSR